MSETQSQPLVDPSALRGPLTILHLDVGEGGCDVLLQRFLPLADETEHQFDGGAVLVSFDGAFVFTSFLPEAAVMRERNEPDPFGPSVQMFDDSDYLDSLAKRSSLDLLERPRHWRIHTIDGTLDVATDQTPKAQFIPAGSYLDRPELVVEDLRKSR